MWETIELRELRAFLVVAEELHFGRSGKRLGVSGSRVSQIIRQLETKLGGQLVRRTSRHVALTPLGERFREQLAPAHGNLGDLLARTYAANKSLEGTLRLGVLVGPSGGPHLTRIIDTFEQRHLGCQVVVTEVPWAELLEPLLGGEIDVLATRLPLEHPDLVVGPTLSQEPRVLAVAR